MAQRIIAVNVDEVAETLLVALNENFKGTQFTVLRKGAEWVIMATGPIDDYTPVMQFAFGFLFGYKAALASK